MPPAKDYTDQDFVRAIAAIKDRLSYRDAFRLYNVPIATLVRKMRGTTFTKQVRGDGFTEAEENHLV